MRFSFFDLKLPLFQFCTQKKHFTLNFKALPSFAIVPAFGAMGEMGSTPGLPINLANVLHGEQYMKLHKPFNPDGDTLTTTSKIGDILDKGFP